MAHLDRSHRYFSFRAFKPLLGQALGPPESSESPRLPQLKTAVSPLLEGQSSARRREEQAPVDPARHLIAR